MIFKVYHNALPSFMGNDAVVLEAFPRGFTHVANVDAENLDDVFQKTNHIDSDWTLNPGVTLTAMGMFGPRSTSVSDVVIIDDERFTCQMAGWKAF
jgi:hypothetical protein